MQGPPHAIRSQSCTNTMTTHHHHTTAMTHTNRSSSIGLSAASSALDTSDNSVLTTALQVFSHLSDLGKAVPFVAPAFVLLKILIDIEQRAQEVDMKCTDILDRISFMLSHLVVLKDIDILPSTRKVVERINEVMKGAVGLITAYRKQSRVARRLSLSNREKFTLCAEAVNTCCRDLLMSLQIHQSKQLEMLLARDIPTDEDDKAAKTFVEDHGGTVDALLHDRELVKEFATQQQLVMDDSVMEQLNTNLNDSVHQTTQRLEQVLKANLSNAVVDGFKDLLAQLSNATSAQDTEQRFVCVQCETPFVESTNHAKACMFHKAPYDTWARRTPCCSSTHACSAGPHRSKHHCDYPYATFFPRAQGVNWYVDTHEEFARVEDTNLETGGKQDASVSKLIRWASRGERVQEPTLLVSVGKCWWSERYFWGTWTANDLEDVSKSVRLSKRTLIFKTTTSTAKEDEYAMAEWILSISGKITGVRLSAKCATSTTPFIRICPLDLSSCTQSGDIISVSDGGMRSYAPATAYHVPPNVRYGPTLDDTPARVARMNFKTRVRSKGKGMKLVMKATDEPALRVNPDMASYECDYFVGKISLFNNNTTTNLPITISTIRAEYRLVSYPPSPSASASPSSPPSSSFTPSRTYTPLPSSSLTLLPSPSSSPTTLPLTLSPRQSHILHFQLSLPRPEADKKCQIRWWNRPFNRYVWRYPLRVRVVCVSEDEDEGEDEDMEGDGDAKGGSEEASLVVEYIWSPMPLDKKKVKPSDGAGGKDGDDALDLPWFGFDNPILWKRYIVKIEPGHPLNSILCNPSTKRDAVQISDKTVYKIGDSEVKVEMLHKIVWKALKTGKTEVDMEIGREHNNGLGEGWCEAGDEDRGLGSDAWYWDAYALVDISCRRVYAVKVVVRLGVKEKVREAAGTDRRDSGSASTQNTHSTSTSTSPPKPKPKPKSYAFGCLGYILLPPYGDIVPDKTRPVSYANESVRLAIPEPGMEWSETEGEGEGERDRVLEDGMDDYKPVVPPKPVLVVPSSPLTNGAGINGMNGAGMNGTNGAGAQWTIPPQLNTRLESIDRNLGRIADVLERLAGVVVPVGGTTGTGIGTGAAQSQSQSHAANPDPDPYGGVVNGYAA
ncbi:hypothetical protein CPB83DRAFT_689017 [Crepidotus variabilis]|uniref:Uncharacterized protein n=1 Tax=Crepidotus variabilis TaxID=179855 RepID=A0A9P6JK57_9AGAR|nr:hypothetical protein CPB83DRAFT_689017 [Crepidotus variabilis]